MKLKHRKLTRKNINFLLQLTSMTQLELSYLLGIPKSTLNDYLRKDRDRYNREYLLSITEAFNISVNELHTVDLEKFQYIRENK